MIFLAISGRLSTPYGIEDYSSMIDSRVAPFELSVLDFACFVNHESTRKFLVLKLDISQHVSTNKTTWAHSSYVLLLLP